MAVPRYRAIAEDLERRIDEGEFPEGSQLPTEDQLGDLYDGASRNTVRDAIKVLIGRRKVMTAAGRGTFVLKEVVPIAVTLTSAFEGPGGGEGKAYEFEAMVQGRTADSDDPEVAIRKASAELAAALQVETGARLVERRQERRTEGRPWSRQTSFYPMTFVTHGAEKLLDAVDIPQGVVAYLKESIGVEQVGYRDRITARAADVNEAAFFNLPDSGIVIVTDRVAYDQDERPIRLTKTVYPADRNHLYVEYGKVPDR
jgi:GntR family transcriptional regulator